MEHIIIHAATLEQLKEAKIAASQTIKVFADAKDEAQSYIIEADTTHAQMDLIPYQRPIAGYEMGMYVQFLGCIAMFDWAFFNMGDTLRPFSPINIMHSQAPTTELLFSKITKDTATVYFGSKKLFHQDFKAHSTTSFFHHISPGAEIFFADNAECTLKYAYRRIENKTYNFSIKHHLDGPAGYSCKQNPNEPQEEIIASIQKATEAARAQITTLEICRSSLPELTTFGVRLKRDQLSVSAASN